MEREPVVRFPVLCPTCAVERLTEIPVAVVAAALVKGRNIRLHATCHDKWWDATAVELQQMREYLDATWIDTSAHGPPVAI
jgi:hypothetical protein